MRASFWFSRFWIVTFLFIIPVSVWTQIPDGYYNNAAGLNGSELKSALHAIVSNHIQYPYTSSSTDVWDILKASDEDPDNSDNVILLYTGRSQAKTENSGQNLTWTGDRWNREHVWSKSHGFPVETDTAFTDCHHLRPADESVNTSRSNKDFDNGGTPHVEAVECSSDSDSWEPRDAVKGDVARMMFYMVVRYDPGYHTDNTVYDLELVDFAGIDIGDPPGEPLFGKLSTLLQWHIQDPVDAFEMNRNEIVFGYQGNRNPFIDHPEWAESIFSNQLSSNTLVGFTQTSMVSDEVDGSFSLELSIINSDLNNATTCDVMLTGGSGSTADLNDFYSAPIIFPAGSSTFQTVDIFITDDDETEEQETFLFSITNVSGGDSASVSGNDVFVLTLNPSDQESAQSGLIISEVMDGNRSGGLPKFIEITNTSFDNIEIGGLQIWRGSNGGEPIQVTSITAGVSLPPADSWVIGYNSFGLTDAGFMAPDQTSGGINGNGNDVYQLRSATGEYIDTFGLVGVSTVWYENSMAERIPSVVTGQASYNPDEWVISSISSGFPADGAPGSPGVHIFIEPVAIDKTSKPAAHFLMTAYPNPFNPSTTLRYEIPHEVAVSINIYDVQGRMIRNLIETSQSSGSHQVSWNGLGENHEPVSAGVFIARIQAGEFSDAVKLVYLK